MKVTILKKLDENTYLVIYDDGQITICIEDDIVRLRKNGELDE
jgi:hypothetical protein